MQLDHRMGKEDLIEVASAGPADTSVYGHHLLEALVLGVGSPTAAAASFEASPHARGRWLS